MSLLFGALYLRDAVMQQKKDGSSLDVTAENNNCYTVANTSNIPRKEETKTKNYKKKLNVITYVNYEN